MVAWFLKCSATVPFAIGRIRRDGLPPGKSPDLTASSISQGRRPVSGGLQLRGLSGFLFGAFFPRCFAGKFYATFVVNADALHPIDVAHFRNLSGPCHAKIRELGNMHEPISTRENFDKRAEFLGRDYASLIGLPDLDFARHATDNFLCPRHALTAGGINVHGTIVFDVNFSACLRDNALDGLPAGADERSDLLRI